MNIQYIKTVSQPIQPKKDLPDKPLVVDGVIFLIPFCFVMIWAAVSLLMFRGIPKSLNQQSLTYKKNCKVLCRNCRFFTSNPYLKCAVHPTSVLTEQAQECADYIPHDSSAGK